MYFKILLFIFINLNLYAAEPIKNITVVSESWDGYTNKDGSGLYFDVVRAIYEPLDITVTTKIYPYNRTSRMIKYKQADFWLASYIDEEDYALYPKYYFDQDVVNAMFKKEKFPNFKGEKDLENRKTCWIRGYEIDAYMNVPVVKYERNERSSILLGLEEDRFDFFLDDRDDMQNAIDKMDFNTSAYKFVELFHFKLYPAFTNDARGEELRRIWDEGYKKLIDDGSLKKIYLKHNLADSFLY